MATYVLIHGASSYSPGEWWDNIGYTQARRENDARLGLPPDGKVDPLTIFFHDVP